MKRNVRPLLLSVMLTAGAALCGLPGLLAPAEAVVVRTAKGHLVSYQPNLRKAAAMHRRSRALGSGSIVPVAPAAARAPVAYKACSGSDAACLSYFGGPVMRTTTLTPVFWDPTGLGLKYPTGFEEEIEQFFTDVAADSGKATNFFSVLTQYSDGGGQIQYSVTSAAGREDKDALPGSIASEEQCATPYKGTGRPCVTDSGLRQELAKYVTNEGLATGLGHEYVVFLPDGLDVCFDGGGEPGGRADEECSGTGFCGYHTTLHLSGGKGEIQYASEPENKQYAFNVEDLEKEPPQFVLEPGGFEVCTTASGLKAGAETLSSTSHEISESVTDPEPEEGSLAWYDEHKFERGLLPAEFEPEYAEIGDMCAYEYRQGEKAGKLELGGLVAPPATNQTIDGDAYLLQTEWDNAHGACSVAEAAATTADFEPSTSSAATGESISFDASASKAPSGIATYEWKWGDGTTTKTASPSTSHSYASTQGLLKKTYAVTLKAVDNNGNSDEASRTVEVVDRKPVAAFAAPTTINTGVSVAFDGSASEDPDGTISSYSWSFGDGTALQSGAAPQHTFTEPGVYTVTLTVTDNAGQTDQISHEVTVSGEATDRKPIAAFAVPAGIEAATPVTFDGSASEDPDGTISSYSWDFGDGTPLGEGVAPQHTFTEPGVYTVTLTVTDNAGQTDHVSHEVTVLAPLVTELTTPAASSSSGSSSSIAASSSTTSVSVGKTGSVAKALRIVSIKQGRGGSLAVTAIAPATGRLKAGDAKVVKLARSAAVYARSAGKTRKHAKGSGPLVGSVTISVSAGQRVSIRLKLTRAAQRLLALEHKLSLALAFVLTPTTGTSSLVRREFTVTTHRRVKG